MFCTAANHLREEFTVFHHLDSRQTVEEREHTFLDSLHACRRIVAHRLLVGGDDGFRLAKASKIILNSLLNEASYFQNMIYQFHIYIFCF